MTLSRRLVDNIAICSARVSANNYFTVSAQDVDSVGLEHGEEVRVVLVRTDLNGDVKPRDRDSYKSTLQKSNQVYIPASTRDKLDLGAGDIVKYVVISESTFPSLKDGPLRGKVSEFFEVTEAEDETDTEQSRPERDTSSAEFSSSMQKTGQTTVPAEVMEKMGLLEGDTVLATIKWQGEDISGNKDIGTGNRITITKSERDELGLEPGDEPTVRLAVFG
jgi:bifunctional DNA-binding transcriptional regulator/antitoxin component of YhaV-PrlF toxin-antitoxin module